MPKVNIVDVTNRDGVQTARIKLPKLSKTLLNIYLDEMGIYRSEIGFPTITHETNYINANLELSKLGAIKSMQLVGWCRAIVQDVELAFKNCPSLKAISLSMSTSDVMLKGKFKDTKSWAHILKDITEAIRLAKKLGATFISINAEDASRTDLKRLIEFALVSKDAGANVFRYCDTLGLDDPLSIYERLYAITTEINMPVEIHCHNDLGMAVGSSVSAAIAVLFAGQDAFINSTVNGYGERAGNCDMLSACLALRYSNKAKGNALLDERLDLTKAYKVARYASYAFALPIPINQPAVGANAFAHESGIHVDGMLKDSSIYEPFCPEDIGRANTDMLNTGRIITAGEYSGIKAIRHIYERLAIELHSDTHAREILKLVQYANIHTQKPLTDDELVFIAKYPEIAKKILTIDASV